MGSVIVGGARTPIGKLLGGLKDVSATDLGGHAIAAALERSGVSPDHVDYVVMGQVLQAGTGQITARQAAVQAGIPMTVPATTEHWNRLEPVAAMLVMPAGTVSTTLTPVALAAPRLLTVRCRSSARRGRRWSGRSC